MFGPAKIKSVKKHPQGWTIEDDNSSGFILLRENLASDIAYDVEPKVGDTIETICIQGSFIMGVKLNGEVLYQKTEEEIEAEGVLSRVSSERKKAEALVRTQPKMDAAFAALPDVFQERILRFRKNNADFRRDYESYEMFCCTEAVTIAERAMEAVVTGKHADEVDAFWSDPQKLRDAAYPFGDAWEEPENPALRYLYWGRALHSKAYGYDYDRHREVTGLSDGHSGNTAGAAFALARLYIESPEYVSKMHGSLSVLVGSQEYGDIDPSTGEPG